MSKYTSKMIICVLFLLGACKAGYPATPQLAPFISGVPGNIHLKYTAVKTLPVLSKAWIMQHCAELDHDKTKYHRKTQGYVMDKIYRDLKKTWQKRAQATPPTYAVTEYWCNKSSAIWVGDVETITYNGRYVCISHPADIGLVPPLQYPGMVFVGVPKDRVSTEVPCLGFKQPGLNEYEAKLIKVKRTSTGFIENRSYFPYQYIFTYNKLGQLTSIAKTASGCIFGKSEFEDYSQLSAFHYPKTVRHYTYSIDQDKHLKLSSTVMEITEYHVRAIDTKALPQSIYNVDYPTIGVTVQDDRPEFQRNHRGITFTYMKRTRTLTDTSRIAANRRDTAQIRAFFKTMRSKLHLP